MSGRSAAWLARLVRDQEVEGSNPFAPTILNRSGPDTWVRSCEETPLNFRIAK